MLEVGSLIWMYPYDIKGLTEDQILMIPAYYKQGSGDLASYYLAGDVESDDGVLFRVVTKGTWSEEGVKTSESETTYTLEWRDIFKVVVKSTADGGEPTTKADRTRWGGLSGKYVAPEFIGPLYGGGRATDALSKEGSYTYVLIGVCLVGVFIFMR